MKEIIHADHLLSDVEMQQFITEGSIQVRANFPDDFHGKLYGELDNLIAEGNPGNNILPALPAIASVYEHPAVRGALTSLLGDEYFMHPHRYCHLNSPGSGEQSWHKDDYIFDCNVRHHRFRWVMAFYYPQDVTDDMGPTSTLPGHQNHNTISDPDPEKTTETAALHSGPAGTVTIVNFDSWHRKAANLSNRKRYMLKFQFVRLNDPTTPSWDCREPQWCNPSRPLNGSVWDWLGGRPSAGKGAAGDLTRHLMNIESDDEDDRLAVVYESAAYGADAVPGLIDILKKQTAEDGSFSNPANPQGSNPADVSSVQALSAVGEAAIPGMIDLLTTNGGTAPLSRSAAAAVLGNIGSPAAEAVHALSRVMSDPHPIVRRNAAEALGTIGVCSETSVPALVSAVADEDKLVRWNALLAIARFGESIDDAVPAAKGALADPDRYTRFYAGFALQRIATPRAHEHLLEHLQMSRCCPLTTSDSPF